MYRRYLKQIKTMLSPYMNDFRENTLKKEGILAFQDKQLMTSARNYLKKYEEKEVRQIIGGKTYLIFNKELDRPFIKTQQIESLILTELTNYLENKFKKKLDQIDRAFLEWEVYEECDKRIVNKVLCTLFEVDFNKIERYIIIKRLERWMIPGDYISVEDLKKSFDKINQKRLSFYKYTHQIN